MSKTMTPEQFFAQCRRDAAKVIDEMIADLRQDETLPRVIPHGSCMKLRFHLHADAENLVAGVDDQRTQEESTIHCESGRGCPASLEFRRGTSLGEIAHHITRRMWKTVRVAGGATIVICPRCSPPPSSSERS